MEDSNVPRPLIREVFVLSIVSSMLCTRRNALKSTMDLMVLVDVQLDVVARHSDKES